MSCCAVALIKVVQKVRKNHTSR